jgi:hypothetical protein
LAITSVPQEFALAHLLDFLALKHLAALRKQEEISTAQKKENKSAKIS